MKRFTIGTDPEFFLKEKETGKLVSAIPYINGTKHEPEALPSGGTIQRDNVAVEFATAPAVSMDDFIKKIRETFKDVLKVIPDNFDLVATPSAVFDDDQLEHPDALTFGCDPDYNAWTISENSENNKPSHPNKNFRSCGGHIHVGHVSGDGNDFLLDPFGKINMVRGMDLVHGIVSVILDSSIESIERRKLYGSAGCHRPTDYGVEYRVLSNYWLKSPFLVMLMDSLTQDVLKLIKENKLNQLINFVGEQEIQSIINNGDVANANSIFNKAIKSCLSADSIFYFEESLKRVENINLKKEWGLEEV